ncbi:MAG: hypothetical protein ACOCQF_00995, partial [Halanaerobiaceae bacterium]
LNTLPIPQAYSPALIKIYLYSRYPAGMLRLSSGGPPAFLRECSGFSAGLLQNCLKIKLNFYYKSR